MILEMIQNLETSMNKNSNENSLRDSSTNFWITKSNFSPSTHNLPSQLLDSLVPGTKPKVYKHLSERPVCGQTK